MLFPSAITGFSLAGALPSAVLSFFFPEDDPVFQSGEKFLEVDFFLFAHDQWDSGFHKISLVLYVLGFGDAIINLRKESNTMQRVSQSLD